MKKTSADKKRKQSISSAGRSETHSPMSEKDFSRENVFLSQAAQWDLEQHYESRPRKSRKLERDNLRLPIKTPEGQIHQVQVTNDKMETEEIVNSSSTYHSELENKALSPKIEISSRQQIIEAQEKLAKTALLLRDNDPSDNVGAFKTLAEFGQSPNSTIKKLAILTQLAVYMDLIPGYRIRPLSDEDKAVRVSKDVKKLRTYEQELVTRYQKYVQELSKLVKSPRKYDSKDQASSLASVAVSCACKLLLSIPHFNFRGDLVKIIVGTLSLRKINPDLITCRETIKKLFEDDEDGNASLDIVISLTKMMKEKEFCVDESVLNLFLHLRLLNEFRFKGSIHQIERNPKNESSLRKLRDRKVFRTKRERKLMRERKSVEQELEAADAIVSTEKKDQIQAEILKRVFLTYFRILKLPSSSLMGAVLEGLAKYAHLINQDFFGDILEALKELFTHINLEETDENLSQDEEKCHNMTRKALLCIITASCLLEGQDAAKARASLHLDLSFFITHLYRMIHTLSLDPSIELNTKSSDFLKQTEESLSHPNSSKVNFQTNMVLFLRSLSSILTPQLAPRAVPPIRIAAFTKQLLISSLQFPEKSCIAVLTLIGRIIKFHGKKIASLWNTEERQGDGVFDALSLEVEGSNPFTATIWEGELLKLHFSPVVRNEVKQMEKNIMKLSQL